METSSFSDEDLIKMLRSGGSDRNRAWEFMFKKWRTDYSKRIIIERGKQNEVDDALGRVCLDFEKRVIAEDKPPIENLRSYLVQCVWHKWLYLKKMEPPSPITIDEIPDPEDIEQVPEDKTFPEKLDILLDKIDPQCKDLLTLHLEGYKMKEIAQKLKFRDEIQVRKRKYKCLKKLQKIELERNPNK